MGNNVSHQMNAYQIYVWIQLVMEISWIILNVKIIMIARAKFALIIYVTVKIWLWIIQIHLFQIKAQHKQIKQIRLIKQIQLAQQFKLIILFINKMKKIKRRIKIS
jgi:hypothetical protein